MSYTTPPITSTTVYGAVETYSAQQAAPALLTRFTPPDQCSTEWYWDTGALRSSSTAFSDSSHNTAWSTCQPYSATGGTYSAGICPYKSEFKSVTQVSWDGVSSSYYVGACCASTAAYDTYTSGDSTGLYGCIATVTSSTVAATMVQENDEPTVVSSAGPITVIAEPLFMVWHESDTALHAASDASSFLAAMNMVIPSETATPSATPSQEAATPQSGLNSSAVIGIAVGFGVCGLIIAGLAYFAFIRLRNRKTDISKMDNGPGQRSPGSGAQAWNEGAVYANELQIQTPNTMDKTHSFSNLHNPESAHARGSQSPLASNQDKDDNIYVIEQKMLLR